jgi:hypothetical protein
MEKEEQLLKQGDDAEQLIKSDTFNNVVNSLVESTFQAFVNTKPEEGTNRERTYNHYRALVDIVNTLQQRVSVRDQIMDKRNNSEEE